MLRTHFRMMTRNFVVAQMIWEYNVYNIYVFICTYKLGDSRRSLFGLFIPMKLFYASSYTWGEKLPLRVYLRTPAMCVDFLEEAICFREVAIRGQREEKIGGPKEVYFSGCSRLYSLRVPPGN